MGDERREGVPEGPVSSYKTGNSRVVFTGLLKAWQHDIKQEKVKFNTPGISPVNMG